MGCGNSKSSFPRTMTKDPRRIAVEINNRVVHVKLDHIRKKSKKLPRLIKDYFETSRLNLDFCIAFQNLLLRAHHRQRTFQDLEVNGSNNLGRQEEVKMFQDIGYQFGNGWISFILSVRRKQLITAEILSARLEVVHPGPPTPAEVANPKYARQRRSYLRTLRPQLRILRSMIRGTETAISLLDKSRELFHGFRKMIESQLIQLTDAQEEEQHTEIVDKASEHMQLAIKDMGEHADYFTRKITRLRTVTLNMII